MKLTKLLTRFKFPRATHTVREAARLLEDRTAARDIVLHGFIHRKPHALSKQLCFGTVRQGTDTVQIVDTRSKKDTEVACLLSTVWAETPVAVECKIDNNELHVLQIQPLNSSSRLATQLTTSGKTANWPKHLRFMELRCDATLHENIIRRAQISSAVRRNLEAQGFADIETPLLFRPSPEGAAEFVVPTRDKGLFYALPQSPQQYKQLLMASGISKYYQIAKCFRDEDLRRDRQPEFTQIDLEMSFASAEDVQNVIETLITDIFRNYALQPLLPADGPGIQPHSLFPTLTYLDAMKLYGSDKPNLTRPDLFFRCLTESSPQLLKQLQYKPVCNEYPELDVLVLSQGANRSDDFTQLRKFTQSVKRVSARAVNSEDSWLNGLPFFADTEPDADLQTALASSLGVRTGDIVVFSDRQTIPFEVPTPLGRCRDFICEHNLFSDTVTKGSRALWVTGFPLFSPQQLDAEKNVNGRKYPVFDYAVPESTHHPFTMMQLDDAGIADYSTTFTKPEDYLVKGMHYDLVIDGMEVGGGSVRIHDAELQRHVFEDILKLPESTMEFEHLLKALEMGCPPHAGIALGFDRLLTILLKQQSITSMIAFPKNTSGKDETVKSPTRVPQSVLDRYHIQTS
ncbi:hypothetical protein CANCADRAFT_4276 [Tortispora caseinolytica NRRL Y-17796]|uniref:Aminoacyl-transfer RNA synthetases class-II family profile domain-containing protein n=1 Tax=Tortispora caseinolytica NRRL Y-17796 TaxID=767744 RepID=A0A1E4TD05_9ASCO|nr:hypothetical protein CANCADRAFT_4276 [Tortispora caseinolytica NRRL Y-17796]